MVRTAHFTTLLIGTAFLALAGCKESPELAQTSEAGPGPDGALSTFSTYVDADGQISLPENFENDWPFIGTWAVAEDNGVPSLHNVYMRESDSQYYRENGEFRDGTVLIKQVRHALGASHTTGKAFWMGGVDVHFVMIKDSTNRFPDNPIWGDGWGWGLFKGEDRTNQVSNDYKADCLGCHEPTRQNDLIYVYGYPAFGPDALKLIPGDTESFDPAIGHGETAVDDLASMGVATKDENELAQITKTLKDCTTCHTLEPKKHALGPSLFGVVGRRAGSLVDYDYSDAMKNSKVVWDKDSLNSHLKDVKGFIPGNRMGDVYPQGVQDDEKRAAIIEALTKVK